ncbi:hypothetical protein CERSUDRAFT_116832 [Gelatoporia subvermispora B]|uniref:Uncharacterized protein n=1 Tax=Ceriporiopsis subvermispora (strain B) TaxID=914234 RepID=M2QR46_CERS8|nr:hypothetical protein CERSUDRAFT_116832 [Gelatoporia subvermispora B]
MNSIFANNRLLPALKRRSPQSTGKPDIPAVKAKPLDILPDLSEEDEAQPRASTSSLLTPSPSSKHRSSRIFGGSATLGSRTFKDAAERKRDSRRVVLTGVEGLTFDDFFPATAAPALRPLSPPPRPAPPPPLFTPTLESPLDDINLRFSGLGISLDFPSPPSDNSRLSRFPVSPSVASITTPVRRRESSPTPSVSSSTTSSTTLSASSSESKKVHITPPTSDDDESHSPMQCNLARAPTFKSHRASVLYTKSMSDLKQSEPQVASDDEHEDIDEDAEWFARDISDVITLATPLPPSFPHPPSTPPSGKDPRARPDSILPPPRKDGRSRYSKALPIAPLPSPTGPSVQLDPTFPTRKRFTLPERAPPPPPLKLTPPPVERPLVSMEAETDALLAQLASAALNAGFLGTGLTGTGNTLAPSAPPTPSSSFLVPVNSARLRPSPRVSLPTDIADLADAEDCASESAAIQIWPSTPTSFSIYSQPSGSTASLPLSPFSAISFVIDLDSPLEDVSPSALPESPAPTVSSYTGSAEDTLSVEPERTLRSRWSTSTLGSLAEHQGGSVSWLPRFNLSPTKRNKAKPAKSIPAPKAPSTPSKSATKLPLSPALKRSFEVEARLTRRDSRSSRMSDTGSDSGESTTSSGLRRKPIPVEIFMRC